jgi:hypothetical protein
MTLLEAHRGLAGLRAAGEPQRAAWLRRILVHNLADELHRVGAGKRDVTREHSLDAALEQSSARLEAFLAAHQSSPNGHAVRERAEFENLPVEKRVGWVKLWAEVRDLRDATAAQEAAPPPRPAK